MAKRRTATKKRRDIYQEVTDRILELLDKGTVPWRNPIRRGTGDGWPKNLDSKKRYRGINVFLLGITAMERGFGSDFWLTYRQAAKQGGNVRKGEKSSLVTFWKLLDTFDKDTGEEITMPVLRHYNVFNAEQCEGVTIPDAPEPDPDAKPFEPIEAAAAIASNYKDGPTIVRGGSRAFYRPSLDTICIAEPENFHQGEDYYATLFHEMVHSTGHPKRLNRGEEAPAPFKSPDYSKEELVAEMGAAFLNASADISPPTIEQSAAYIDHWKKALRGDKRLVVSAAGAAQKAADWILGSEYSSVKKKLAVTKDSPKPEIH